MEQSGSVQANLKVVGSNPTIARIEESRLTMVVGARNRLNLLLLIKGIEIEPAAS